MVTTINEFRKYFESSELDTIKSLSHSNDFLLVNLDGNVSYNIDGILEKINNKRIFEYPHIHTRNLTMMDPKNFRHSFLYSALTNMISNSTEIDGWYNGEWTQGEGGT